MNRFLEHCLSRKTPVFLVVTSVLLFSTITETQGQLQAPSPRFGGATRPGANGPGQAVSLQFPDNQIDDILAIYEKLIGKPIVKDSSVREGPNISLVTPSEVPKDEAIRLIEATLLVNGYVLVSEPNSKKVTILRGGDRSGGASPSFSEGTVIYTDPAAIPDGDSLVGFFMTLDYISPFDAATIFQNHISFNDFGKMTPVSSPQGLLITETSPIIRSLIQLRSIIDRPTHQAPLLTEFVPLEHAEANIVAQIIQAAMDARMAERERQQELQAQSGISGQTQNQGQNNNNQRQQQQNGRNQQSGGNQLTGIGTADQPAAQLIPDDRLNRIMVVASPSDAAYVLELIREFDQPLEPPSPVERPLQYVKANDILPVIVDILQDTGTGETQLPGGRQIDSRPTPITSSQLTTLTGTNNTAQNNQNRTTNTDTDVVGGRQDQIAFPIDEVAPISVLVGKTRIIADRQSNTMIIVGGKEAQKVVLDMIDRLDRRPIQVYLATVIGEMTLSDDVQFGVDYIHRFNGPGQQGVAGGLFARRTDVVTGNNISDLASMITTTPFGPAAGLNLYGHINSSLDSVITALETTNRFKVLSRPVIYTQNGKRAEITSGQEVPVPVQSLTDTNNINAVQTSIDFKEVVLKLEVLPTINDNDEVTLDIVQINDRVIGNQVVGNNNVPIIGKQELNTTVSVANRSTIILGGLISESITKDENGVPVLSRIPILGHAAKQSQKLKTRSELMIFIQPVVVHCDQEAVTSSYDEDVRSEVGQSAAQIFPEPGAPTLQHRNTMIEEQVLETKPFQKLGRKIFGPKKTPTRDPLPIVAQPVHLP
ncbi:MAG: secretin N-terminal domain-containing protein [Verrucomicrobiales bacterium]|nr:secretin N-terminal domain-containing protein [Verrucomicrobiales bacterium]